MNSSPEVRRTAPRVFTALLWLCGAIPFGAARARAQSEVAPTPALSVLLVIDQMRPDYFERFDAQLTGGLGRLERGGAFFVNGRQDHAITQTAPGHATLLSGRPPAATGIMTNEAGVGDAQAPLIGAPGEPGASPRRFQGTTLYDWMLAADSGARMLSVSAKDRAAIPSVGRAVGPVFWYAGGRFTTSTYYADTLPGWVRAWNDRRGAARLAGHRWSLLRPASDYPEQDSLPFEHSGRDFTFPHVLPSRPDSMASRIIYYPWMDSLTIDLALEGVRRIGLGRNGHSDLLVVSLSTTDRIGHDYGPDSREIHDHILRVDQWLGWFLDSLAVLVPRDRTVLVLSSDHGIGRAPDLARSMGQPGGRVWPSDIADSAGARLRRRYRRDFGFRFQNGLIAADTAQLRALGVDTDSLAIALSAEARRRPGVARVFTPRSLAAAPASDIYAGRWKRSLVPGTGWLIAAVPEPGYTWANTSVANHGSALNEDVTVPIIIMAPGVRAARFERVVPTVDIAPTLARLLGVTPTEPLAGHVIPEIFRR